jgi:hypothetical protein
VRAQDQRHQEMENGFENVKEVVVDRRPGVILQLGGLSHRKTSPRCASRKLRLTQHWGANASPFLPLKSDKYYIFWMRLYSALLTQHAKHMRGIILSSVVSLAVPYFSTLSQTRHDFRKKYIEHNICNLIFSPNFVGNISHSKKIQTKCYYTCK